MEKAKFIIFLKSVLQQLSGAYLNIIKQVMLAVTIYTSIKRSPPNTLPMKVIHTTCKNVPNKFS